MKTLATESDNLGPDDRELVRRAQQGDRAAPHELVNRHAPSLLRLAVSLVGNAADAEDVLQETFSGAFRGLAGFKGQSSFATWLTRILVRQSALHLRGRRRWFGVFRGFSRDASSEAEPAVPSASPGVDARMDVTAALATLSPEHREVMVLRELQGFSYEEIAEMLAIPRGTVESRLFRARRAMQGLLKDYLPPGESSRRKEPGHEGAILD